MRRRELISASARPWCSAAIALAAAAAAFAALGAYAIAQPTTKQVRTSIPYTQRATFGYTAPGPALVYPGGQLRSGDPVYLRLVPAIDVTVTSVFDSAAPRRVSGTTSLRVDVSDGTGWHESMELAPPAPFQGTRTEQTARLDLASLQGRLAEIRAATGVANTTYNLDIVADIHMTGTLDGHRLDTRFAPHLPFQLDTLRLAPITSASEGDGSALARSAAGHLAAGHRAPRRFEFGGGGIPIHDLRRLALIAAVAGAIAALAARRGMNRRLPDDAARTALRHRSRLVGVTVAERHAGGTVFDVAAIDDLVRLADQHAALILHERTDAFDVYQFEVGRTTYRLRQPRPRGPRAII